MSDTIGTKAFAEKWGCSQATVAKWCKKILTFFVVFTIILSTFTGCQVTDTCPSCGEKKPLYIIKVVMPDGSITEEVDCKDCTERVQELLDEMNDLGVNCSYTVKKYTG